MDGPTESEESKRKAGYYRSRQYCGVCGDQLGAQSVRCPEDGIICHTGGKCSKSYNNKELGVKQMLCIYSYDAKLKEEERKEKEEKIRAAKIIFALLLSAIIFLLVKKWF